MTFSNFQVSRVWKNLVNVITFHILPVSICNLTVVFSTSKSWMSLMLTFVWPLQFSNLLKFSLPCEQETSSSIACIMLQLCKDIHYFKISDEFNVDLCLNILIFWTRSCSNGSMLQLLVHMIIPQNLPTSCCNFTGRDVLFIRISAEFDVDLCVTFLNFQSNPKSNDLVNGIISQKLHIPCCSFKGIFFHIRISQSFMLIFMHTFEMSV